MHFYSTRNKEKLYSIEEALMAGIAPDGGLFMPSAFENIYPQISQDDSFTTIAQKLVTPFLADYFLADDIQEIVTQSFDFEVPIVPLNDNLSVVELFHGPTLAFKDFGGRFMANALSKILSKSQEKATILVATSGDTGSAVANGFFDKKNIEVVILYPKGKVSHLQELQLTTFGKNIRAICVDGTFDDCQRMVKTAFADAELTKKLGLTSANSINIGRLLPQMTYYAFAAHRHFAQIGQKPTIIVPSGNFGNITAGLFVKKMGFPIQRFIAATNANDVVPTYFTTGHYTPRASVQTISNAMDVGTPSNMERILSLYDNSLEKVAADVTAFAATDEETANTMKACFQKYNYIADPHTAVGLFVADKFAPNEQKLVMATAHPAKFKETVEDILRTAIELPIQLNSLLDKPSKAVSIRNDFEELRGILQDNI
jgi:threonine synthase